MAFGHFQPPRLQNYTNMVVGKHRIQKLQVVVIVVSFALLMLFSLCLMVLTPQVHIFLIIFGQVVCADIRMSIPCTFSSLYYSISVCGCKEPCYELY